MLVVLVLVDVIVTVQIREKRGSDEEDRLCVHDERALSNVKLMNYLEFSCRVLIMRCN